MKTLIFDVGQLALLVPFQEPTGFVTEGLVVEHDVAWAVREPTPKMNEPEHECELLDRTSPSGKALFRCIHCGYESPAPVKAKYRPCVVAHEDVPSDRAVLVAGSSGKALAMTVNMQQIAADNAAAVAQLRAQVVELALGNEDECAGGELPRWFERDGVRVYCGCAACVAARKAEDNGQRDAGQREPLQGPGQPHGGNYSVT